MSLTPPFDLLPGLLSGLSITLQLTAVGALLAFALAWIVGLARLSRFAVVRGAALVYVEVFRGTSALVQLFWFYFALPLVGIEMGAMTTGILVLGLNIGAYGAEVVRGAVQSIERGQHEAATALSMTPVQRMRLVILPQAAVAMLPPGGNLLIELLKATALVSMITLSDLTFRGQILRAETLRTTEIFGLLLLIYFAIAMLLTAGVRRLERHLTRSRRMGGVL